jgi:tRNA 2-thiouridine synthesizing protein A
MPAAQPLHMDASGLICPLPVLKARKRLLGMAAGDMLVVRVTDASAPADFALFCKEAGHRLDRVAEVAAGIFDISVVCGAGGGE